MSSCPASVVRPLRHVLCAAVRAGCLLLGIIAVTHPTSAADDAPAGPRADAWKAVTEALEQGKPKTALEKLAGLEQAAAAEKAWGEVARAIATRILAETGDRPPDDPQRLVLLAGAIPKAPAETKGVLEAIQANWIWGFFQMNRWRFQQRTAGGSPASDIAKIAEWDLPTIVGEIRKRFAAAIGPDGSPERRLLQGLPVADFSAIIEKGTLPDAYRPTVWDVVVRDALEFAASGERGLVAPEDAFEIDAAGPALGSLEEFLAWKPEADEKLTDRDAPLLETIQLYRTLLDFHRTDADRTALLSADLDRILALSGQAVFLGDGPTVAERKRAALEAFAIRAEDHDTATRALLSLAEIARSEGDLVGARKIAAEAAAARPKSPWAGLCKNLVASIEAKSLSLVTEQTWAAPWPVIRVSYRNLARVHLRLCRADWLERLKEGRQQQWFDENEQKQLLKLPAVRQHAADLPATPDYRERQQDVSVAAAFDPATLPPGTYWLIASHTPEFTPRDNVVYVSQVRITRLAIVGEQSRHVFLKADAQQGNGPLPCTGHVVDIASGEPIADATVRTFVGEQRGNRQVFVERGIAATDANGRYEIAVPRGHAVVTVASATLDGVEHQAGDGPMHVWPNASVDSFANVLLVTDRGIHRPGQTVFYKGIASTGNHETARYEVIVGRDVDVVLRDANGREVGKARHTTSPNGSFHGSFTVPAGALPGQWVIQAQIAGPPGAAGGVGVRVEEYKRPKFLVSLASPEDSTRLGGMVSVSGTATTYTGLPVANAKVVWHVERTARWPDWCRWFYPGLPISAGAQRIARGIVTTDEAGKFTISFPARPDLSVPRESSPVFSFRAVADVTDAAGETRSDEQTVTAGYDEVEATVMTDAWQATAAGGGPAEVAVTVATRTLNGQPSAATGSLTISRLVQPAEVDRGSYFGSSAEPWPMPARRGGRPRPPEPNPADPQTWAAGEVVFREQVSTAKESGSLVAKPRLAAGIYRAVFEIPAAGDVPTVRAEQLIEVLDPSAERYGVKKAFVLAAPRRTVAPQGEYRGLVGTGYDRGRVLVEISQSGKVLERRWTEPGRTQWPLTFPVTAAQRGGFTVRAWMVRDGRLHTQSQTIDVPWTDKQLAITWERFTRRVQPGSQQVWRAKITSVADPVAGPVKPVVAEMVGILYDQSLDALAGHAWPGLQGLFRRESGWLSLGFTNGPLNPQFATGSFKDGLVYVPPQTYRVLRDPFGTPARGGWLQARRGRVFAAAGALMEKDAAMPQTAMAMDRLSDKRAEGQNGIAFGGNAERELAKAVPGQALRRKQQSDRQDEGGGEGGGAATSAAPPPRKNLVETAFFMPAVIADEDGNVTLEFTLPDTLTTWQFKGLAHDAGLRSGTLSDTCVSAKDLMIEPVVPRFLREGDLVRIPVKVSNTSTGRLAGNVRFALADARTGDTRNSLIDGPQEQSFDLAAGESKPVVFTVKVADGTEALTYTATGSAGAASDGEEAMLPVLPRRVLVTETVPVTIRGPGERKVTLERLVKSGGTEIRSQSLVVQGASNPAWYAVLALPSIMEQTDESTETLFTRLYANTLARHLATRDPRIQRIFEQWRGTAALESPLEKNTDLVKTLLAETPWVRDAVDEQEARARIGLLFDANHATQESEAALARLAALRNGDGGWPWFPGGRTCDSVTLGIIAGFGRLRAAGVPIDVQPALQAIPWLDGRLVEEKRVAELTWKDKPEDVVLTPIGGYALYARSFFTADAPPQGEAAAAIRWGLDVGKRNWSKLAGRMTQGHVAIALARGDEKETARSIVDSLKQRAVDADVRPGAERENWQGMWWRDQHPSWWSWASAPIATQTIMIEAFDEVAGDRDSVEALKVWLLSQKRTSQWSGSRATADAVSALLGRGTDLLASQELLDVTIGGEPVKPEKVEAGTGFFEERLVRREITPQTGVVTITKKDQGLAWGGVHWQYLDDIANVPAVGRDELAIEKTLFVKRRTKAGPELVAVGDGAAIEPGDELVVRLVVTSDRDYEFLELADHRASLTEPVDVLSGWRWGDGVGWYVAVRDASMQLFFERLPRGTHVFEYSLRAAHRGTASTGFATIRSRYAPEFSAHSASVALEVRDPQPQR